MMLAWTERMTATVALQEAIEKYLFDDGRLATA